MSLPPNFTRYLTACIFMLCSYVVEGQTIDAPTVSGTPVCAGSTVSISFNVTNGAEDKSSYFTTRTEYYVHFGTGAGAEANYQIIQDFKSQTAPESVADSSAIITMQVTIPATTPSGTNYRIGINSRKPTPSPDIIYVSSTFKVGENPSGADPSTAGNNNWIGHVYNDIFGTYLGNYTMPQTFDESFGSSNCFTFSGAGETGVVNTETFSVRYRMNSTKKGLYVVDVGSDDGSRLRVDGNLIYNNWVDQAYSVRPRVLMSLNQSQLVYEFYENLQDNRVSFDNLALILENQLTGNTEQQVCSGNTALEISGDVFGALPDGISLSGTGYQWAYSTTPGGTPTDITGATSASFTPDVTTAPFSSVGTYYIFRKAVLSSNNNIDPNSYVATNESNAAILKIEEKISYNSISLGETGTVCGTVDEGVDLSITAPAGTVFLSVEFASYGTPGGTCGSFNIDGTCHSTTSQSVVESYLVGNNSAIIPATNAVFGDPCSGTFKRLYVQATYGVPKAIVCGGDDPSTITGTKPEIVNDPVYLWENSITGPDEGYSAGPGTNNQKDYSPGSLEQTTWFRRKLSNFCGINVSNIIEIEVNLPTAELSGPTEVCVGETVDLTATFTGNGPFDFTFSTDGTTSLFEGVQSPFIISVAPSTTTTYSITSVTDLNGCTNTTLNSSITVNVKKEARWTGAFNTDWNTASNWECNAMPNLASRVIIPGGLTNYPVLEGGDVGLSKNIKIETGASVQILNNTLNVVDTLINNGTFDLVDGSLELMGTSPQVIPANTFKNSRIRNLTVNNLEGVVLEGDLEVSGIVRVESGIIASNNFLKLISNITQTALIDGSGNGQITGTVKMQRYLDNSFGYKYFSAPFQNSVVGDFAAFVDLNESFSNFYSYNENRKDINGNDATGWEVYTNSPALLNIVEGYALNFGDSIVAKTVEISGTVNNGNFSRILYNNNGLYTQGFNLVGNPYPSPIDWNATTGWTKTNVDDAIYFFTAGTTNRYTGTYSSYVNGVSSSDGKSSNIIPSMQGFFVHVSDITADDSPTAGSLAMTNEVRTKDFAQEFLKAPETDVVPLVRITAGIENNPVKDPLVIYFNSYAKNSFEKDLDALKLTNTDIKVPNFYSITPEQKHLSINALPYKVQHSTQKVPLGLKIQQDGWIIIQLKDLENLPSSLKVYLIDNEKRIGQNLSDKPTYKFYSKAGEYDNRFHLLFSETIISDPAVAFDKKISVQTIDGRVYIKMNLEAGQRGTLTASTVTGQILGQKTVSGQETIELQGIKSSGIYFISLSLNGEIFSKKILIEK